MVVRSSWLSSSPHFRISFLTFGGSPIVIYHLSPYVQLNITDHLARTTRFRSQIFSTFLEVIAKICHLFAFIRVFSSHSPVHSFRFLPHKHIHGLTQQGWHAALANLAEFAAETEKRVSVCRKEIAAFETCQAEWENKFQRWVPPRNSLVCSFVFYPCTDATAIKLSGWVSQALNWLIALNVSRNALKWSASQKACTEKLLITAFSWRKCSR